MTIAANVASGSFSNSDVRNSSVMTVTTAAAMADSSVLAPAPPLTAVLERLPLTTMPLESPAPRFAVPSPSSSRFTSMS